MPQQREFTFVPASRQGSMIRLGLCGPAGSGKTWTLLEIATAMAAVTGDQIGLIDTERQSAGLYSPPFKFLHQKWQGPYEPQRLVKCLAEAAEQRVGILILDTWSRFWSATGGMLEQVDHAGGKGVSGWKTMRPVENEMVEAMLAYPGHLLVSMRVKTAFEIGKDENGKVTVQKIGLKPEQREGMEYEFTIVGDMDQDNKLTIAKTRCPELNGRTFVKPGADIAQIILTWLETVAPGRTAIDYRDAALAKDVTADAIRKLWTDSGTDGLHGAAIIDPRTGEMAMLKAFLERRGTEVAAGEKALRAAAPQAAA